MTIKELAVKHAYYCSDTNFYSNEARAEFETWEDFIDEMGDSDLDYCLCFRFDIKPNLSEEDEEIKGKYRAEIFIMQQRKGQFVPITVEEVKDSDVDSIIGWLTPRWNYLKKLWKPIAK